MHYFSNSYLFWIVPYPFILPSSETEVKFSILPMAAHYPWKYRRMVAKFIQDIARRLIKVPLGEVLNVPSKSSPLVIITTIATTSTIPPPPQSLHQHLRKRIYWSTNLSRITKPSSCCPREIYSDIKDKIVNPNSNPVGIWILSCLQTFWWITLIFALNSYQNLD